MPYTNFQGMLAKIRESFNPLLSTTINDIKFELEEYYEYTRTEEDFYYCNTTNKSQYEY